MPVLYSFRRCPYAMRARMTLRYSGIQVELREVVLKNKPTELIELSPKGTVPVLALDEAVLDESFDIMLWALEQHDPENWLDHLDEAKELITANDFIFKPHLDGYKYAQRDEEGLKRVHRNSAEQMLTEIDVLLSERTFLHGEAPGLADVALLPFVRQFANVDIKWFKTLPYHSLMSWLACLLDDQLFVGVMAKYSPWTPGDRVTIF